MAGSKFDHEQDVVDAGSAIRSEDQMSMIAYMRPVQARPNQATAGSPQLGQLKIGLIRPPWIRLRFRTFRQRFYLLSVSRTVRREVHGNPEVRDK